MQIPDSPKEKDAQALLDKLDEITSFTATRGGVRK